MAHPDNASRIIRLLVVEDETMVMTRLQRLYGDVFQALGNEVAIQPVTSLTAAKTRLSQDAFDLVSLDLNVAGQSGFELLQQACCSPAHTIIVSAYRDQAITAYEYGALDFIAKPFSRERIEKAVRRFLSSAQATEKTAAKCLLVKSGATLQKIALEEIEAISGYGNYSKVLLLSGRELLHEKGLEALMQLLPPHFMRVHKSYILNLKKLRALTSLGGGQYQAESHSFKHYPVGRSRIQNVRDYLQQ